MSTISNIIDNNKVQSEKNLLYGILKITSICLTIFTVLFSTYIISSNIEYQSFGSVFYNCILILITIGIFTLIIHILIIFINFIWKISSNIRQQLSIRIISFFIASFLICPLFMFKELSTLYGFEYGFTLSFSIVLFIVGIITTIKYRSKFLKLICFLYFIIGCIGLIINLWFYFIDGFDMNINVKIPLERWPKNITNDPSLNGNYSYKFLTYGSGFDHRIEYGINASIITPTIDLSSIIKLSLFNKKFFKYNESSLPLNGRIWYPINNSGPYNPIILMVHGNHVSTKSSENGYDYLGKMLSSQGFIVASIDENFLNGVSPFSTAEYGKISKIKQYIIGWKIAPEFIARAMIILETLKQFQLWNKQKTNQFYNQLVE